MVSLFKYSKYTSFITRSIIKVDIIKKLKQDSLEKNSITALMNSIYASSHIFDQAVYPVIKGVITYSEQNKKYKISEILDIYDHEYTQERVDKIREAFRRVEYTMKCLNIETSIVNNIIYKNSNILDKFDEFSKKIKNDNLYSPIDLHVSLQHNKLFNIYHYRIEIDIDKDKKKLINK